MLLAIDVGNTQTVIGLYGNGEDFAPTRTNTGESPPWLRAYERRAGDADSSEFLWSSAGRDWKSPTFRGVAVSSGVPIDHLRASAECAEKYFEIDPVVILGAGVKTGMAVLYDNPKEVGADRIANAVGAYDLYGGPSIVVDFGTATTFDVISEKPASIWAGRLFRA